MSYPAADEPCWWRWTGRRGFQPRPHARPTVTRTSRSHAARPPLIRLCTQMCYYVQRAEAIQALVIERDCDFRQTSKCERAYWELMGRCTGRVYDRCTSVPSHNRQSDNLPRALDPPSCGVYHTKVLFRSKKERNQRASFVVKSIVAWTKGLRIELQFSLDGNKIWV